MPEEPSLELKPWGTVKIVCVQTEDEITASAARESVRSMRIPSERENRGLVAEGNKLLAMSKIVGLIASPLIPLGLEVSASLCPML
ncbi:MAG: hypothetical protein CSA62_06030 [Planctomycetota bacterium]|nr:MAG: hypothetical protein CSA62_06030 [Planctomycetota bacterium]